METIRFDELNLDTRILRAVAEMGFEEASPIQSKAIPVVMEGKDIIGQAQTGTGKTAAFGIPLLQKIDPKNKHLQTVILCPTRELAIQVADEIRALAKFMHGIKVLPIYGGQNITHQIRALKSGVQVVIGTPGRVIDHIERGNLDLIGIESVVLDEADEMLEMGFKEDIEVILSNTPRQRQTLLFSATIPSEIREIAKKYQRNPKFIKISSNKKNIPKITQYYYKCDIRDKFDSLTRLIKVYDVKLVLIFCNTKKSVDFVKKHLKKQEFNVDALHGDMTQKVRDKVMNKFRNGNINILVATDVAARGLDIDDVDVIINYDVAQNADDYTHRIGRTARAGKTGYAFSLVSKDEISRFNNIKKSNEISQKQIPTLLEINEIKSQLILNKVKESKDNVDEYIRIIKKNENKEVSSTELAARLLKMIMEN